MSATPEDIGQPTAPAPPTARSTRGDMHTAADRISERMAAAQADEAGETPDNDPPDVQDPTELAPEGEGTPLLESGEEEPTEAEATEGEGEPTGDPEETESWGNIDELMEAGETNPESLQVTVTVDGEQRTVTLKEALSGYQRQSDYDRLMVEVRGQKESIAAEQTAATAQVQQQAQQMSAAMQVVSGHWDAEEKAVRDYFDSLNWVDLRASQPAEYAALQADYQNRLQELNGRRKQANEAYNGAMQGMQAQLVDQQKTFVAEEQRKMVKAVPEWSDPKVRITEGAEVSEYLRTVWGATEQELEGMLDHRVMALARESMLYRRAQAKGTVVRNGKGKKLLKPGSRTPAATTNRVADQKEDDDLKKKLGESHRESDAAALISRRMARAQR